MMPMLTDVKLALRISGTTFDDEINDLIETARQDLILSGVLSSKANDDTDALIKRAILFYCKANFGWDNTEADRLQAAYESIKHHLTLTSEYTTEEV
jgi:uncharacterized phage protein (predicted DNA packaging)